MLEGYAVVLQYPEQAIDKPHLTIHQVLADGNHGEAGLARDPGDLRALDNLR